MFGRDRDNQMFNKDYVLITETFECSEKESYRNAVMQSATKIDLQSLLFTAPGIHVFPCSTSIEKTLRIRKTKLPSKVCLQNTLWTPSCELETRRSGKLQKMETATWSPCNHLSVI